MFKGLFTADLHCSKSRKEGCLEVLNKIYEELISHDVPPYLFICGDFWDAIITNSTVFNEYIEVMKKIIATTKVFMIYGTPSHEVEGSLEIFRHLGATVFSSNTYVDYDDFELIAIPEPRKSHYASLTYKDMSINDVINDSLKQFAKTIPPKSDKPRIAMVHSEIRGVAMDNGMPCSSPISIPISYLKALNADFIGCGHIHLKQEIFKNCWYLGSAPQKTLGEKHNPELMLIEF